MANLCHNCRGCYYACQYTAPHQFDLNLPKALAEVRRDSWKDHAWPAGFGALFDRSGVAIAAALALGFALIFALAQGLRPDSGAGFYAYMSHGLMVAVFAPAFLVPLVALAVSLKGFWTTIGGGPLTLEAFGQAMVSAGQMNGAVAMRRALCYREDT